MLLDQDSIFGPEYFQEFYNAEKRSNVDLFLPKIMHKGRIISPTKIYYAKGFYYKEIASGFISSKKLGAINSGMIISSKYLIRTRFSYDIRLGNYCTDDFL